jgi:hypothetical protein
LIEGDGTAWFIPNEAEFTITPEPTIDSQAQLAVAAFAMGTLATPKETDGIFQIGDEALSGEIQLNAPGVGRVFGTFSVARSGESEIDLDFRSVSTPGLSEIDFLPEWSMEATAVDGGPGQVNLFGTLTMNRLLGPVLFTLSATILLDGDPTAVLDDNLSIEQTASAIGGMRLTVHTRTLVEGGVTIDAPDLTLGTNPPPLATVRATPNPIQASTHIAFTLTHRATGSIRIYNSQGRLIRTVAEGTFEPGAHQIPFDGLDNAGRPIANGGYYLKLQTDQVNAAGKLFVVR